MRPVGRSLPTPGVDNAWFNCKETMFGSSFILHFVPNRDIAQPWQVKIYWAFLRTKMCWSAKLIHFPGYSSVDNNFRVAVVDQDCTNIGKFILKSRFRTYD